MCYFIISRNKMRMFLEKKGSTVGRFCAFHLVAGVTCLNRSYKTDVGITKAQEALLRFTLPLGIQFFLFCVFWKECIQG